MNYTYVYIVFFKCKVLPKLIQYADQSELNHRVSSADKFSELDCDVLNPKSVLLMKC